MATTAIPSVDELVKLTSNLSVDELRVKYPTTNPATNPQDIYRIHITNQLEKITGVDPAIIYPAVNWTQALDRGDAVVAVPALRVKGKKPDELAKEVAEKVRERESRFCCSSLDAN